MRYEIYENRLSVEDFIDLFDSAGWGRPPYELVKTSLDNSYVTFCVMDGDRTIAMARLLGDGGMAFLLKDFVVLPDYQGQGVGRGLMAHIENYIRGQLTTDCETYFQLMSAKGKDGFYEKLGFISHPHEHSGHGFTKRISRLDGQPDIQD